MVEELSPQSPIKAVARIKARRDSSAGFMFAVVLLREQVLRTVCVFCVHLGLAVDSRLDAPHGGIVAPDQFQDVIGDGPLESSIGQIDNQPDVIGRGGRAESVLLVGKAL